MSWKLVDQPLDSIDIENILEGTGIIIKNKKEMLHEHNNDFYLCWVVFCDEPHLYLYDNRKPRGYEVLTYSSFITFIWLKKLTTEQKLSIITPDWEKVKKYIDSELKDAYKKEKITDSSYIVYNYGESLFYVDPNDKSIYITDFELFKNTKKIINLESYDISDFIKIILIEKGYITFSYIVY
jgi:hypothetical protein